jgi:uncharacterized membrane protein YccF (DUF307 family)
LESRDALPSQQGWGFSQDPLLGCLIRFVWFLFIGCWLGAIVTLVAWLFAVTIVGLPVAFWLFDQLPGIYTFRPKRFVSRPEGTMEERLQFPLWLRALYFPFGLVVSLVWVIVAEVLALTFILIPVSFWMYGRIAFVTTLKRM